MNRNTFLASSSVNFPLIASERNTTTPLPFLPSSFTLHIYTINNSFSALSYCPTNTSVSCLMHRSLILVVSISTSAWLYCHSCSRTVSAGVICASHSKVYYPTLVFEYLPHFLRTPHSHTNDFPLIIVYSCSPQSFLLPPQSLTESSLPLGT
jgi:hypothetical protein